MIHRGDDARECVIVPDRTIDPETKRALMDAAIKGQTVTLAMVVRCKDCQHCRLLNDGVSFECTAREMDFYAPTYNAATYFCADGKRRTANDQSH